MSVGMPVVDDGSDEAIATVSGVFLHPDLGTLEGLFVQGQNGEEFLSVQDIIHWGRAVVVRDGDVLGPLEERVRLSALWAEGRTVLGQRIATESGDIVGRCADVQFETDTFRLEWLFPRRWFRWKRPIPAGAIIEVRPEAVCVRDAEVPVAAAATAAANLTALETPAQ
jgi:sporulation protein YlmC with PRC-barrel domain